MNISQIISKYPNTIFNTVEFINHYKQMTGSELSISEANKLLHSECRQYTYSDSITGIIFWSKHRPRIATPRNPMGPRWAR